MKTLSFLLAIVSITPLLANPVKYTLDQGKVVYQIKFNKKLPASVPDIVQSYFSTQDWKYAVFFDSTASIENSPSGGEEKLSYPFKWDDQCIIRQTNTDNCEFWKELNGKRYRYNGQIENSFQSFTGNRKTIAGLPALECIIKLKNGTKYTGWVTDALPRTAGLQLVKGCSMALISANQPNASISIFKTEKQAVEWKNIWNTRPAVLLKNDDSKEIQQMQPGSTVANSTFPVFNIITSTGKRINQNGLSGKTTVFFFCDPLLSITPLADLNLKTSKSRIVSPDEKYLNMMEKAFRKKNVQVVAPIPYRLSEIWYTIPSLKNLQLVSIVADPLRTLFDALRVTNYPFVVVFNQNRTIRFSTSCNSDEDAYTFIAKTLQIAAQPINK